MSLALLYFVAFVAYGWHFATRHPLAGRVATGLLMVAVLVHTFVLGMYTMELGVPPMAGRTGAVSTFVWMLAVSYLSVEVSTDERGIGVFVTPLMVALQALVSQGEMPTDVPAYFAVPFFAVHVGALLFAYASFALACVIGITYVLLFRELKRRTPGMFFQRLPSLQALDRMNMRAVWIGWLLLTVGLVGGALWLRQANVQMADDPRLMEQFAREVAPQIRTLAEQGRIRFAYHPIAFLGPESTVAANAAVCAADEGRFWDFHEYLFANQFPENSGALTPEHMMTVGNATGTTGSGFASCVQDVRYREWVGRQTDRAFANGVHSTPTVLVDGRPLDDPFQAMAAIQAALAGSN